MRRVLVVLFAVTMLTACKKEVKIEKNLWKNGGEWNIDVYDAKTTSTYFQQDNNEYHYQNAGTVVFKKDGTGSFTFQGYTSQITYTNTDKALTLTFKDEDGITAYDETRTFDLDWKKNKMELSSFIKDTYSTSDGSGGYVNVTYTDQLNYTLSKKK